MADFLNAHLIVKELSVRIQTAWGLTASVIYDYPPLGAIETDHAVIVATGATKGSGGAKCKSFIQSFTIVGQFDYPASTATTFRTEKANALLTEIYKDNHFKDGSTALGSLFGVDDIAFDDIGEDHSRRLELRISFQIETVNTAVPVTP
jgi:hypothetical protein